MRIRNRHTLFSAMVRGDTTVTLWNRSSRDTLGEMLDMPPSFFNRIKYVWDYCSFQRGIYPADTSGQARHRLGPKINNILATVVEPFTSNVPEHKLVRNTGLHLFNFFGFRLRWVKALARGGNGAATLWQALYEDGTKEYFVFKILTAGGSPAHLAKKVQLERDWHDKYARAECIVQHYIPYLVADRHAVINPSGEKLFPGEVVEFDQLGALPLEFMTRGSLKGILAKAAELRVTWPNAALWQLFKDLAMGVSEVALHRRCLGTWKLTLAEMYREELLRPPTQGWLWSCLKDLKPANDVHLDLEENNILATDTTDSEGKPSLRFKLHDFGGWSYEMDEEYDCMLAPGYMSMRRPLKPGRHLPEQIVREWDEQPYPEADVFPARYAGADLNDRVSVDSGSKTRVAGRYGFWSNTFIIAKMLEVAITGYVHTHPFAPKVPLDLWSQDELKQAGCPNVALMHWPTYGWRLAEPVYAGVCPNLRWLVIACLAEDPRNRPSPADLLPKVALYERQGAMKMDLEAEAFWERIKKPIGCSGSYYGDTDPDSSSDDDDSGEEDSPNEDDPNDEGDTQDAKEEGGTELTLKPSNRGDEHDGKHEDEDITMKDASSVRGTKRKNTSAMDTDTASAEDGAQHGHHHKRARIDLEPQKGAQDAAARRPLVRFRPRLPQQDVSSEIA
ncbi:uncharacterized protein F5Z01DRAFT_672754 [Emericellopsis atlantica]|uniref:Protein kinase domain-containing protein n=1 Tax=Emericellopsis atlantica TaxID=2614577 RepID=A0A9P7ZQR8_9HYPO|nr:uncharacterized protein F5Z01DRAFT_672754 [Emericellopsis atlantica]KAG9256116.1 hypothetical protein F5Z01DRAFT_672754 [Emericellopsis atlantica]